MDTITVENVVVFLSAFALGWVLSSIYFQIRLMQSIKILQQNLSDLEQKQEQQETLLPVYNMETDQHSYFLYTLDDCFVKQASTIDKLAQALYNDEKIEFAQVNYQGKTLQFEKGIVHIFNDTSR